MILDLILLILLGAAAWTGYRNGILSQAGSVLAVIVAVLMCRVGGEACAAAFSEQVGAGDPTQSSWSLWSAGIVANVILFVVTYLVVRVLFGIIKRVTHAVMLGPLDGIGGAVFRVILWALGISIVLNLWLIVSPNSEALVGQRGYGRGLIDSLLGFGPWLWGQLIN